MALTNTALKNLKPKEKAYKVPDRDGMYVIVSSSGRITFRYDYRLNGRRETLTMGQYDAAQAALPERLPSDLEYGMALSLADARQLLARARMTVKNGDSPARQKADGKQAAFTVGSFGDFAEIWLRDTPLAESTKSLKRSVLDRDILPVFGKRKLDEITAAQVLAQCEKVKARGARATAVQVKEVIQAVYRHATDRGIKIENPAAEIRPSAIAVFKPRERALSPAEIGIFFEELASVAAWPQVKLAVKLTLLTLSRKSEILKAQWTEIDWERAVWTVPAERMKARRPHNVYLSQQALDILVALQAYAGSSPYVLPGRYDTGLPMSDAALNRIITATVEQAQDKGKSLAHFGPHDLRRTASTLLHEAGFNSDWIEKCLAHEQKGVRAVYNKAEYADQRREMLQRWADMVDGWTSGVQVVPFKRRTSA